MKWNSRLIVYVLALFPTLVHGQQVRSLQFIKDVHDFGKVDINGGSVVYQFDFTNVSDRPVKILNVKPSCGCTTPDWSRESIQPGRSGFVQASFDPRGRPGFFNKSLTITTDFDSNPVILQIKGNVAMEGGPAPSEFRSIKGNLRLKVTSFNMGKVLLKDEYVVKEFPIQNGGDKPITFSKPDAPAFMRLEVAPSVLPAGEQGIIKISYNGKLKGKYGFQSDNIVLHTDDAEEADKSFSVYATVEEYFPPLSKDELARAPQLSISTASVDFGSIAQNAAASKQISLVNTGKTDLLIREVQSNCTCVKATVDKKTLKPGGMATLTIEFNPQNRQGTQQKRINIYSNDPSQPVQAVMLTAQVN
jgi:hypothetical protein